MNFQLSIQFKEDIKRLKKENPKLSSKVMDLFISIDDSESTHHLDGIGKPELLKGNLGGCYSRKINDKHRLIYKYLNSSTTYLVSCYGHYDDK
ncbi:MULTISPECIES: Txe/YoeB family addiction module toxin [Tenacibaculum]|uniref:Txe/YoeB family addiction module toxin n=1 Tax=Tenacibaculum TaxID=104267 RepID=UPI000C7CA387|nr:Txe/YoeB family addiction module toxin [Tenacibaculum finnmarkense]MCD8425734.1 Txe/YoeB family addiction module toxin [Tenacibaculum dicentrarchi]MCD8435662.1 Txe/YoeB family addiction module toxin [Tenacibaculum dicentrarchi]MCD8443094.1 Txe/YoeB family addiction module toxin [Tenacibaculum dicentrarchi]MCG8813681.1 Txe/YoeB family addiction module toxin [Tenacibaculum finnmarkense]